MPQWNPNQGLGMITGSSNGCDPKVTGCMIWKINSIDPSLMEVSMTMPWCKITRDIWWTTLLFYTSTLANCDLMGIGPMTLQLLQVFVWLIIMLFIVTNSFKNQYQVIHIQWFISGLDSSWLPWCKVSSSCMSEWFCKGFWFMEEANISNRGMIFDSFLEYY